jgi:hypothetical protein
MKKYASDFIALLEAERKKHSEEDFIDLLTELKEDIELKISQAKATDDFEALDDMSHLK